MNRLTLAALLFFSLLLSSASAQVGKDTGLWDFKRFEADKALVLVETEFSHGSGVCITSGHIATALHVIEAVRVESEDEAPDTFGEIEIHYQNGQSTTAIVAKYDSKNDIALLIPKTIDNDQAKVKLATEPVKPGDKVWFSGFGRTLEVKEIRSWSDRASRIQSKNSYFYDTSVLHGDSGGGCFNSKGELVGLIRQVGVLVRIADFEYPAGHVMQGPKAALIADLLRS